MLRVHHSRLHHLTITGIWILFTNISGTLGQQQPQKCIDFNNVNNNTNRYVTIGGVPHINQYQINMGSASHWPDGPNNIQPDGIDESHLTPPRPIITNNRLIKFLSGSDYILHIVRLTDPVVSFRWWADGWCRTLVKTKTNSKQFIEIGSKLQAANV